MAGHLDFYFFYGSIHSYLSVMRIGALASAVDVAVRWQPFNLREILIEQNNTAFTKNDVKMNYFWRDVERRARRHNIPFAGRAPYPADPDLLALRVGLIAAQEQWCDDYSRATFHDWFIARRARRASMIISSAFLPRSIDHQRRSSPAPRARRASVC